MSNPSSRTRYVIFGRLVKRKHLGRGSAPELLTPEIGAQSPEENTRTGSYGWLVRLSPMPVWIARASTPQTRRPEHCPVSFDLQKNGTCLSLPMNNSSLPLRSNPRLVASATILIIGLKKL